jgi:L-ascorbate metabolism protein UlaG (beta-lactamase superfamily)
VTAHPVIEVSDTAEPGTPSTVGELQFIGTATMLVQLAGFTLLTDPNFLHQGEHARLGWGLRSQRRTEPALSIEELPPYDAIVLSHHHGDHFDDRAARELRKDVPILTTPHAAGKLTKQGFTNPRPLETWEWQSLRRGDLELRVTSMPGRHGPPLAAALVPPVMGSMLELRRDDDLLVRCYISGDTLVYDALDEIPRRYPHIDLGVFHLGGTRVAGVLLTMDAEQGVRAVRIIDPDVAIPIHYDDYTVFKSPLADFRSAADTAGLRTHVEYLARGDRYHFPVTRNSQPG